MAKKRNYTKRRNTGRSNSERDVKKDSLQSTSNDPSWYASDPSILRDAASIPFSWALGTNIKMYDNVRERIPGVMALELVPTVGYSDGPTSAINVAATATYGFIRHANSGHANYDSPDLMMYIVGMSGVYSYINWMMRLYGMATLFAQKNRYLSRTLLEINHVDYNDVINNLASFRYAINVIINKASSLAVPANMTLFNRQAFLYQNVYSEGQSVKDQMYMYVPAGFHQFDETYQYGGRLVYTPLVETSSQLLTVNEIIEKANAMLDPILASEDMNIMSGDILKAYGQSGILKLMTLGTDYSLVPVWDPAFLEQFQNASLISSAYTGNFNIEQDPETGIILSNLTGAMIGSAEVDYMDVFAKYLAGNQILSTAVAESSPELVVENTRLKTSLEFLRVDDAGRNVYKINSGSEIPVGLRVGVLNAQGNPEFYNLSYQALLMDSSTDDEMTIHYRLRNITVLQPFAFRLIMPQYRKDSSSDTTSSMTFMGMMGNIGNYAVLSAEDLARIHEAALMNQLHVPSIARV